MVNISKLPINIVNFNKPKGVDRLEPKGASAKICGIKYAYTDNVTPVKRQDLPCP